MGKKNPNTRVSDLCDLTQLVRGKSRIDSGTVDSKAYVCFTEYLPISHIAIWQSLSWRAW